MKAISVFILLFSAAAGQSLVDLLEWPEIPETEEDDAAWGIFEALKDPSLADIASP